MSRNSRFKGNDTSSIIVIFISITAWTHWEQLLHVAYVALGVMGCLLILRRYLKVMTRRSTEIRNFDSMSGLEFEHYIAKLLQKNGFHNISLTEKYDLGVDIIAEKHGIRWGIQVKRYSGLVNANAVRQVVSGLRLYSCDRAIVITNSKYSPIAQRLAAGNDCILIDRIGLNRLGNNRGVIL